MGVVTAVQETGGAALGAVPFPAVEWFERLAELMTAADDRFRKLGTVDCTMVVDIVDGRDGEPWRAQIVFEEFGVASVAEVGEDALDSADFILETDLDTWREMVESIVAGGGRPDLDHTLNRLSLPGTPIRVWSSDPLGRDMFFRFNQSLQAFVNNCVAFETAFPPEG